MADHYEDEDAALLAELEAEAADKPDSEEEVSSEEKPEKEKPSTSETDDDELSYGKRVQKRINQLTKKTRELEGQTQYYREKFEELENRAKAWESNAAAKELSQSETQLQSEIDTARATKRRAIEEGDIDEQIKADELLLDLREQLAEKRRKAESMRQSDVIETERPRIQASPPVQDPLANLPEGTQQWLQTNTWFMAGEDPRAAEIARALDVELQEEGYSPDDPEMYAELDKRLSAVVPRRAKAQATSRTAGNQSPSATTSATPDKRQPRSPVAASSADGQGPASAKPARRLTQDDLVNMRKWGFDPRKESDRRSWLRRNDLTL